MLLIELKNIEQGETKERNRIGRERENKVKKRMEGGGVSRKTVGGGV